MPSGLSDMHCSVLGVRAACIPHDALIAKRIFAPRCAAGEETRHRWEAALRCTTGHGGREAISSIAQPTLHGTRYYPRARTDSLGHEPSVVVKDVLVSRRRAELTT